jgi:hypothetical protein
MSSILVNSVSTYLKKYLLDFERHDLSVSLLSGSAELRHVELDPAAVQQHFSSSITLRHGKVDRLRVELSLLHFKKQPIVIKIGQLVVELEEREVEDAGQSGTSADAEKVAAATAAAIVKGSAGATPTKTAGRARAASAAARAQAPAVPGEKVDGGGGGKGSKCGSGVHFLGFGGDPRPLVMSGWLGKSGRFTKQRRWFALRAESSLAGDTGGGEGVGAVSGKLYYSQSESGQASQLRGSIELAAIVDVRVPRADQPLFELITATRRWPLVADTNVERDGWLRALRAAGVGAAGQAAADMDSAAPLRDGIPRNGKARGGKSRHSEAAGAVTFGGTKKSYSTYEKIVDGISVEIQELVLRVQTKGKQAEAEEQSAADGPSSRGSPPPLVEITLRNLQLFTVDEQWRVANLSECRRFSKRFPTDIYVFKQLLTAATLALVPQGEARIVVCDDCPISVRSMVRTTTTLTTAAAAAAADEKFVESHVERPVTGSETTIELSDVSLHVPANGAVHLAHALSGLVHWSGRVDWGEESAAHTITAVLCERLRLTLAASKADCDMGGSDLFAEARNLRVGLISPEGVLEYVYQLLLGEMTVGDAASGAELLGLRSGTQEQERRSSANHARMPPSAGGSAGRHSVSTARRGGVDLGDALLRNWTRSPTTPFNLPLPLHPDSESDDSDDILHAWSCWTIHPDAEQFEDDGRRGSVVDKVGGREKSRSMPAGPPCLMMCLRSRTRATKNGRSAWHNQLGGRLARLSVSGYSALPCYVPLHRAANDCTALIASTSSGGATGAGGGGGDAASAAAAAAAAAFGADDTTGGAVSKIAATALTWCLDVEFDHTSVGFYDALPQEGAIQGGVLQRRGTVLAARDAQLQVKSAAPKEDKADLGRGRTATRRSSANMSMLLNNAHKKNRRGSSLTRTTSFGGAGNTSTAADDTATSAVAAQAKSQDIDAPAPSDEEGRAKTRSSGAVRSRMKRAAKGLLSAVFDRSRGKTIDAEAAVAAALVFQRAQAQQAASAAGGAAMYARHAARGLSFGGGVGDNLASGLPPLDHAKFDRIWMHGGLRSLTLEVVGDCSDRIPPPPLAVIDAISADMAIAVNKDGDRDWVLQRSMARLRCDEIAVHWCASTALLVTTKVDECYRFLLGVLHPPTTVTPSHRGASPAPLPLSSLEDADHAKAVQTPLHLLPGSTMVHVSKVRLWYREDDGGSGSGHGSGDVDHIKDEELATQLHDVELFRLLENSGTGGGSTNASTDSVAGRDALLFRLANAEERDDDEQLLEVVTQRQLQWQNAQRMWSWIATRSEFTSNMSAVSVDSTQLQRALVPLFSEAGQLSTALERSAGGKLRTDSKITAVLDITATAASDPAGDAATAAAAAAAVFEPIPTTLEAAQAEIKQLRAANAALHAANTANTATPQTADRS